MKTLVVAGIGTGVGKTIVSAVLTEALKADYWKPVQAGDLHCSDTMTVKKLVSNGESVFHPERYCLTHAMSPHAAAELDGVEIRLGDLALPVTQRSLVVELAGGLMVPVNAGEVNAHLLKKWGAPVILVSQNYLGSINHTLLSLEVLKTFAIPVLGIIFNGEENRSSEEFIMNYSGVACIGRLDNFTELSPSAVSKAAETIKERLLKLI